MRGTWFIILSALIVPYVIGVPIHGTQSASLEPRNIGTDIIHAISSQFVKLRLSPGRIVTVLERVGAGEVEQISAQELEQVFKAVSATGSNSEKAVWQAAKAAAAERIAAGTTNKGDIKILKVMGKNGDSNASLLLSLQNWEKFVPQAYEEVLKGVKAGKAGAFKPAELDVAYRLSIRTGKSKYLKGWEAAKDAAIARYNAGATTRDDVALLRMLAQNDDKVSKSLSESLEWQAAQGKVFPSTMTQTWLM